MPQPPPKLKSPINANTIANLVRRPSVTNKLQRHSSKQSHPSVSRSGPAPELEQSAPGKAETAQSIQPRRRTSEETVFARPAPSTEATHNALEDTHNALKNTLNPLNVSLPPTTPPIPPSHDPFPTRTPTFLHQLEALYSWFSGADPSTPVLDLATQLPWHNFPVPAQKMLFIHGAQRIAAALRENQTLRMQGGMLGQEGVALRAFADLDVLRAEQGGWVMGLEEWRGRVSDPRLGEGAQREVMQVTIAAMAKLCARIGYQNSRLADEVAQGCLMRGWIEDGEGRLGFSPEEGAGQLVELCLGARVLLKGALEVHERITAGVESFNQLKRYAMELEKVTGRQLGFEHLREHEIEKKKRGTRPHFHFGWDNYTMEFIFWRPVPYEHLDLWRTNPDRLRQDLAAMLERPGIHEPLAEGKSKLAENFFGSLALGAEWVHLIDREGKRLDKVMKERWKDEIAAHKDAKASAKMSAKGKAPVEDE